MTVDKDILQHTNRTTVGYKYWLIVIPAILYYCASGLGYYAFSEWIQHSVKTKLFPNGTFYTSVPCKSANHSDPSYNLYKKVESESAIWMLYATLGTSIPALITSSLLPSYSDSLGRRFLFVIAISGCLIKYIIITTAIYFSLSPIYAVVGSIVDGISGSYNALQPTMYAYAADCTTDGRKRTIAMASIDGMEKLSMTITVFAAGYFIGHVGYFIPSLTAALMAFVALCFFVFFVPESYPKLLRSKTLSVTGNIRRIVDFYTSDIFKGKRCAYLLIILAYFLSEFTSAHRTSLELLYQLGKPFCWSAEKIGLFGSLRHVTQGLSAMFLVKPLKTCLKEVHIAIVSCLFKIGSYALEGLASSDLALYMVPVLATFSNLAVSMSKCIMSLMTPSDKQGSLFASIYFAFSISAICAPFLMNTVYADTVDLMSGLVFLVIGGLSVIALVIWIIFWATQSNGSPDLAAPTLINNSKDDTNINRQLGE